jgi:tetratricopeptide (TPR) repeat protein
MQASKTSLAPQKRATSKHNAGCTSKSCAPSYHPYVNHAACVEHRQWWHSPPLMALAALSATVAVVGLASTLGIAPDLKTDSHMAMSSFSKTEGLGGLADTQFEAASKKCQDLINRGQLKAGIDEYRKAAALPNVTPKQMAELYNDLAIALHQCGKTRDSLHYLEKAVRIDDKLVAARNNLALVRQELSDRGNVRVAETDDSIVY